MTGVDVLIVAALPVEYAAARAVGSALAAADNALWREHDGDGPDPYEAIEIKNSAGVALSVALARPTRMGGRSTAATVTALAARLNPQCLAMCGVCAGNPDLVGLGDVVVAELAYEYDEGKRTKTEFLGDHRQVALDDRWVRVAQDFSPIELGSFGQATREEAKLWFLERLRAGDEPRAHPARPRYFPPQTWRMWTAEMQTDGLIVRSDQGWELTAEGKAFIERKLYDDVDGPDRLPFAVTVAPMASGTAVFEDGLTWELLAQMGVRTVAALEMEAATVATVALHLQIPHWLVAKGVMDHADPSKDDRYKTFAAMASAEVLYALLTRLLPVARSHSDIARLRRVTDANVAMRASSLTISAPEGPIKLDGNTSPVLASSNGNIAVTSAAGTGKTTVLHGLAATAMKRGTDVVVLRSTDLAAPVDQDVVAHDPFDVGNAQCGEGGGGAA